MLSAQQGLIDNARMGYNGPMLDLLKSHFGYHHFLPLQKDVITNALAGKDSLVLMPTGAGKSLCYQLPALRFGGLTLVVSPLIALMKDQVDALKANGIAAEFINSTLPPPEITRVQAQAIKGQVKILYVAPERLALSGFQKFLQALEVSLIAIDEAHCISEWGHDFRPDYRNLKLLRSDFPHVPVMALTATATEGVRQDISDQLGLHRAKTFLSSFNRANLTYDVRPKRNAFNAMVELLNKHSNQSAIIYCFSRKDTENLAEDLSEQGLNALPYHAGLDNSVRKETQESFIRDEVRIVVATIAFGMGIDKPDIRLVAHYDLPKSLEGYYQETGRAGRDGLPSDCVLFYSYSDKIKQDFFINDIEDDLERQVAREKLAQMIEFCELHTCRRGFLLEYFGEKWEQESCNGCDVCLTEKEEFDATMIAQKILSAVIRTGERFGANHVCEVLRGARTKRIRELEHDQLSVYGIVDDFTDDEMKDIIGQLLAKGLLVKNTTEYPTLAVTQAGWELVNQREKLALAKPKRSNEVGLAREVTVLDYDHGLFEKLRRLRTRIAGSMGVPPYIIFGDKALLEMAYYFPQSTKAFALISGVGTEKLGQHGESFLSVIRTHARLFGLEERRIPRRRNKRDGAVRRKGSTYDETKSLFLQRLPIDEIAEQRGLAQSTVIGHLERLITAGEDLDIDHLMPPPERLAKIKAAFQHSDTPSLFPVRESLGEDFTYEELRLVRMHLRQQ